MVKNKIIFVDSDGTVMDSMTLKHNLCFGPALITIFDLEEYKEDILREWNDINLYRISRGINRFDGLYQVLVYVNNKYKKIDLLSSYKTWLDNTKSKSSKDLELYISTTGKKELQKVVDWNDETNRLITLHQNDVMPFNNVKDTFEQLHKDFTIIIISSANNNAVMHEWNKFDLLKYVDKVCTQEMGSKEHCIALMLDEYKPVDSIMLGDAKGDLEAARHNKILFYPLIPKQEDKCWLKFKNEYSIKFLTGEYKDIESKLIDEFLTSLK